MPRPALNRTAAPNGAPHKDCFYNGETPAAASPPQGKKMSLFVVDAARLLPDESDVHKRDAEVAKLASAESTFERLGDSDAAYRGKRMFGEGAHKANAYLFVDYGSFAPPKPRPYGQTRNPSDDELRALIHKGNEAAREREVERLASLPSAFDRNLAQKPLMGFYKIRDNSASVPPPLSEKRTQRGLLDGVLEKSADDMHPSKRVIKTEVLCDPLPIPGFNGVGVGQMSHLDKIHPAPVKETMPPMQPHYGTHHDLKYGVHGFTECPPAPPLDERNGWFNWVEDRQKCKATDAGFDPLLLKANFCSPGDPLNHPQRMKRIELATPEATYLLRNQQVPNAHDRAQCVKMFPAQLGQREHQMVPGFRGLGDPTREAFNDRPRGMRKLSPHHEEPRRAKSSLDYWN